MSSPIDADPIRIQAAILRKAFAVLYHPDPVSPEFTQLTDIQIVEGFSNPPPIALAPMIEHVIEQDYNIRDTSQDPPEVVQKLYMRATRIQDILAAIPTDQQVSEWAREFGKQLRNRDQS